jgi:hypothetical protein
VEAVLDLPVSSYHGSQCFGGSTMTRDVVRLLGVRLALPETGTLDGDDGGQVGPEGEGPALGDRVDPDRTRGEAVAGPLGLRPGALGYRAGLEMPCGGEKEGLVGLEGDQVVGTGGADEGAVFFRQ